LTDETQRRKRVVRPVHLAVLLLAVTLSGCGSYSLFDPDTTASFGSSGKQPEWLRNVGQTQATASAETTPSAEPPSAPAGKADSSALNSLFARAADAKPTTDPVSPPVPPAAVSQLPAVKPVSYASTGGDSARRVDPAPSAASDKLTAEPRGRAYLYRGVAGLIYSRGMDSLAARIRRAGLSATVSTYLLWREDINQAIRDYRRDGAPITIIGHSMGGDAAVAFAERLNAENIPVSLLVTYDPTRIADDVPPNVERYINIYQSSNVMGGGNVVQGARFHGHYASYNLKDHSEIVHINIEKSEHIQEQLVSKIVQLATTPASTEGEAVPLHLQVPADASIELWDSGLPVFAHSGDTLKSIAATYHVPLWSLAEANPGASTRTTLDEGQRIIVPRRLAPMAMPSAVSSYAPTAR
jgi:LysM repeat protein